MVLDICNIAQQNQEMLIGNFNADAEMGGTFF